MSPDLVIPEPTHRWKVLHFEQAPWKVGERDSDRAARVKAGEDVDLRDLYPDSYAGKVISVIPAYHDYTPGELCDPTRAVVKLKLNADDLAALRSRSSRIGANLLPAAVTFDQKHGAVGPELKRRFPLDFLVHEKEEEEALLAVEERNAQAKLDWQAEVETWRVSLAEAVELGAVFVTPAPALPPREPLPELEFAQMATRLAKLLPKTEVHSGAGLYKVQAAGTMATPAHLWAMDVVNPTDDGSAGTNDGTGANVTVVGGVIGSALDFNGSNSSVNVGDLTALNAAEKFTLAFRIDQDVEGPQDFIFWKQLDANNYVRVRLDGEMTFEIVTGGTTARGYFTRAGVINAGQFHHVAIVYNGLGVGNTGRVQIYVDGLPITLTYQGTIPAVTPDLATADALIGWTWNAFDGQIDDFRVYTDALTDAQVKDIAGRGLTHYNTIASFDDNLLTYSEDFSQWSASGTPTVSADTDVAPNGSTTADTLGDDSAAAIEYLLQDKVVADDTTSYVLAVHLKKTTAASSFPGITVSFVGGSGKNGSLTLNTDTGAVTDRTGFTPDDSGVEDKGVYWRFYVVVANDGTGNTTMRSSVLPSVNADAGGTWGVATVGTIVAWGAQTEVGTSPSTYRPTRAATDTQVTLTTGGLTDGDRDGEVFISGGNSYAVIRNGVDSALVAGDATGESGDCSISPYTHFQSAADQLFTDQGAGAFTASQYIRAFAGTYVENLTPNASLAPDPINGYPLIIEGAPSVDRTTIILAPSGGTYACNITSGGITVRHMKLAGTPTNAVIYSVAKYPTLDDIAVEAGGCHLIHTTGTTGWLHLTDSSLVLTAGNFMAINANPAYVSGCTLVGPGGTGTAIGYGAGIVESSVVAGWNTGFLVWSVALVRLIRNCTFYDCNTAVWTYYTRNPLIFTNNIVSACATPHLYWHAWPEESEQFGATIVARNNCYHNYTNFAVGPDGATKTYSQFATLNRVDASGDLDDTDPLMTDPGAADFSLQTTSPCWDTGHGSGVTTDYLGTVLDPAHPPIGAWSPGALVKTPPTMSVVVAGTTITATLAGSSHRYRVRLSTAAGVEQEEKSRAGAGDVVFTPSGPIDPEGVHFRLQAWAVTADDAVALGEPSIIHDAYVAFASAQTASGPLSLPIENLRTLLSNSDDFQALVGVGDAAGALGYIHYPYQDADEYSRPVALIEGAASWNARQPALETVQIFLHDGEMAIRIERDVDSAYQAGGKERDAYLAFTNVVGAIISDLESGAIAYLDVRAVRIVEKARRVARTEKSQGRDYYSVTLAVEWGG